MITQEDYSTSTDNNLLRQIKVKESQLEIARECNMPYITESLQNQLAELHNQFSNLHSSSSELESQFSEMQSQSSDLQDLEFQALMSLLDDE
ncbi:MAG: hypothetical protein SAK29_00405 [Scytonema sp. PMC 1069.18]|nr:hypothetical protein [Scytonema sp. PMC 1069.18]MEC4882579.1 hypothetical protein [Scytonema sp. PMC 1070.18]